MLYETGFFSILQQDSTEGALSAVIRIHPEHEIFSGHFPDLPITPGVCLMQIVREVVEIHFNKKQSIKEVHNMKFLSPYNPLEQEKSDLNISFSPESGTLKVSASLSNGPLTFFKLSAIFHDAK